MRLPLFDAQWPNDWKQSYHYDQQEIFGPVQSHGYANSYRQRQRRTLDLIKQAVPPPARILDIAAAQGNFSLTLAELGYQVTWNDLRADLIDYVKLKYEKGDLEFRPGNAFELAFDHLFDVVVITEIIEHVAHPDEFLAKAAALVKPGGYVLMTTPNGQYFRWRLPKFSDCADPSKYEAMQFQPNSDGHIFLLHVDEIEPLGRAANLEVKSLELFTNPLTNGHVGFHRLLPFLPTGVVNAVESATQALPSILKRRVHNGMAVLFQRSAENRASTSRP